MSQSPIESLANQIATPDRGKRPPSIRPLLDTGDVAAICRVHRRQIARWRDRGSMPQPIKLGKSVRWRAQDIEDWLTSGCPDMKSKKGMGRP